MYPRTVFTVLVCLFLLFTIRIYLIGEFANNKHANIATGKQVWQGSNCHTCHQLYGLGGYLGPDLTNIMSKKGYTPAYVKTIIKNGRFQMPSFNLTNQELDAIVAFLSEADKNGSAHPHDYSPNSNGTFDKQ
jgi:nitric oxide reductase subunit C